MMWKWPKCAGTCGTAAVILKGNVEGKEEIFCSAASSAAGCCTSGGAESFYGSAVLGEFLSTEC